MPVLRSLAALASLALATSSLARSAPAQYGLTWIEGESLPGVETVLHYGVHALDDGGALTFSGEAPAANGIPDELVVIRYSRDGEIQWRAREPIAPFIPFPGFGPAEPRIDVRGDGTSAFTVSSGDDLQVILLGPDGALSWRRTLQATRLPYQLTAATPFVDSGGEVVLATNESMGVPNPSTDVALAAVERFDASGASVFRVEALSRVLESCLGTPSGDVLFITNDALSPATPPVRRIQRFDRSGAQVAAATQPGSSQLLQAVYDPRTDGALLLTRLSLPTQSFAPELEVHSADGSLLATGTFGTSGFGALGAAINASSGVAYFGGFSGSTGQIVGYDVGANEVVSASPTSTTAVTVLGLRPDGGLVTLESRATNARVAANSAAGVRLSATTPCPSDSSFELTRGYAAGNDGRFYCAEARSRVAGSTIPSSRQITQLIEGTAGTAYCSPTVNSTGNAGLLMARGSNVAGENRITLVAFALPPTQFGLVVASQTQGLVLDAGGGQGTLCLSGSVSRFTAPGQVRPIGRDGLASLELDLTRIPTPTGFVPASTGQTWNFQIWHRDVDPTPTSNLTNGVEVMLR